MTDEKQPDQAEAEQSEQTEPGTETAWERKRRLAEIFGDALPDVTGDERDPSGERGGKREGESASDAWLKSQVPPHHG